ncbi:pancreatic secretory granule membrane major glycoprotein GP2-like [Leptodactylus fuscus]|uniref:pancreatic secretory granule membrane major glycoprotein GP2-like n=1 Tax=Leptodactylus fuscus TaxID=238119 RepID=UPI003F4EE63D
MCKGWSGDETGGKSERPREVPGGSDPVLCSADSCAGFCIPGNGCLCKDGFTNCVPPSNTECPMEDNTCCSNLVGWYWDSNLHCCTETPFCYPYCTRDEVCSVLNEAATCDCNSTTYEGIKISDVKPIVSCEGGLMTVSVCRCQLQQLGYDTSSFHLINDSAACNYPYTDAIDYIRVDSMEVKAAIGWCGNVFSKTDSKIYFTNTLHISPKPGLSPTISPIAFNFTCEYNLTMQTSLSFSPKPIRVNILTPQTGSGTLTVVMAAYSDPEFIVPIQQSDVVYVKSKIYLGLFSPDMDGRAFALRVEKCFATPTSDPNDPNQFVFVNGGCAVNGDVQTTVLQNGNATEARIQTSAFLFNDYPEVYIFCNVRLCDKSIGCEGCNLGRSSPADTSQLGIQLYLDLGYFGNSGHCTGKIKSHKYSDILHCILYSYNEHPQCILSELEMGKLLQHKTSLT